MISWIEMKSQSGWIFKSKANVSYCLYHSGPMVRHYALAYGFESYVPESVEKPLREAQSHVPLLSFFNRFGNVWKP